MIHYILETTPSPCCIANKFIILFQGWEYLQLRTLAHLSSSLTPSPCPPPHPSHLAHLLIPHTLPTSSSLTPCPPPHPSHLAHLLIPHTLPTSSSLTPCPPPHPSHHHLAHLIPHTITLAYPHFNTTVPAFHTLTPYLFTDITLLRLSSFSGQKAFFTIYVGKINPALNELNASMYIPSAQGIFLISSFNDLYKSGQPKIKLSVQNTA